MAKGYNQTYGIDYKETFAPIVRIEIVRLLLGLAAGDREIRIHHMDIVTAYLNGDLEEEVYMELPEGFQERDPNLVCKLLKGLYGTKQGGRCWNVVFTRYLRKKGLKQLKEEPCVFVNELRTLIIAIYVDDMFILGREAEINQVKIVMAEEFKCKDLGELSYFLGMQVVRDEGGIFLGQEKYCAEVIKRFGMEESKPAKTPREEEPKIPKKM